MCANSRLHLANLNLNICAFSFLGEALQDSSSNFSRSKFAGLFEVLSKDQVHGVLPQDRRSDLGCQQLLDGVRVGVWLGINVADDRNRRLLDLNIGKDLFQSRNGGGHEIYTEKSETKKVIPIWANTQ